MIYATPLICTATLSGLLAGRTYGYRVAGHTRDYSFTMPPDPTSGEGTYPFSVGLTADLGQTRASRANVELLRRRAETVGVGVVLLAGDLSYADGWLPRWDTYGRMMEPLAAAVPVMTTAGNHELGSDVGPVHLISLCSYAATAPGSLQHRWLRRDLARIDRSMTPWVIVMMHAPWYNTNSGHKGEAELMRQHMEADLYEAGVDLVLSGHVHAYERTLPVYRGLVDECGPVYLNLGDGGNYEGAYMPWLPSQPSWSAFRQATFGVGLLTIVNQSHAWYNWSRSSCMSANGTGANGDPSLAHINLDAESCMSRSSSKTDNAEDPYANQDGAWIMRSSATRQRCIEQYNATIHGHGRLIFVALLALGFGAAIGATSAVFSPTSPCENDQHTTPSGSLPSV
ncbi:purple acid phosphatase 22-like protein [Chrysochromulina tobinii]|uniref:Purple acid phosphatase 22-like protein n=1 Tax=Chrysochromulina tobinii TaxID=1460289 RepID=A0A0M0J3Q9_9EUKA|nr:purple acid phosphatase 22-like protein [Chrysochromulina tobinii]|eukprot:KOO20937.1 purple acid phosphatase 22-like protein [Chrysochromulina sp. CCMP291]